MLGAAVVAILVQWGTTGAAILIAYNTPVKGFGCRSATYTLYGALGTIGWLLHVISMCFSHSAMLQYQAAIQQDTKMEFVKSRSVSPDVERQMTNGTTHTAGGTNTGSTALCSNGKPFERDTWHTTICILAVSTRALGKITVIVNAAWIIIGSLMEIINIYENCWCLANRDTRSWVLLFKSGSDLKAAAQTTWGGGVALSIMTSFLGFLVFWLGSREVARGLLDICSTYE